MHHHFFSFMTSLAKYVAPRFDSREYSKIHYMCSLILICFPDKSTTGNPARSSPTFIYTEWHVLAIILWKVHSHGVIKAHRVHWKCMFWPSCGEALLQGMMLSERTTGSHFFLQLLWVQHTLLQTNIMTDTWASCERDKYIYIHFFLQFIPTNHNFQKQPLKIFFSHIQPPD